MHPFYILTILRFLWILVVPVIAIVAAIKLWRNAPRWIPVALFLSAFLDAVPQILFLVPFPWSRQLHEMVGLALAFSTDIAQVIVVVAVLALAVRAKRIAE